MGVLVTGGAGYIGSHTCVELLNQGKEIIVLDNFYNSKPECLKRVQKITGRTFPFYELDLLDYEGLDRLFSKEKIDSVVHFAGFKAVGESVRMPLQYYHNNIMGTVNLCRIMGERHIKKLVFSSSATVYGGHNPVPYKEDMPIGSSTSPYGNTKCVIEQILQDLYVSDPEWRISILRYFNPIGAHESGMIGEDPNGTPNNLMPFITQVAIQKIPELHIFGNDYDTPDGTCIRDYIHVMDLADGHLKALAGLNRYEGVRAYNLGTGKGVSVLDMIQCFEKASGQKAPYQITERRPGDIAWCYASVQKAKDELGFTAQYQLEDMCRDSWNWQRQNPDGM